MENESINALTAFLDTTVLKIPVKYYIALLSVLFGFVGRRIVTMVSNRLLRFAEKTRFKLDDIFISSLQKPLEWAMVLFGVFGALFLLDLPKEPIDFVKFRFSMFKTTGIVAVVWICVRLADGFGMLWEEKAKKTESKLDDQLVPIVRRSFKVFLYIIGIVFILQNLGYSVTSLLAGFGLGGAALAFASKDTVANLFGSMVIFLDKPFQIGDWIEMDSIEGTVEDVGLRTIRVRTFSNSVITVPNSKFTTNAVNNWSRMKKRRIKMTIGVTYSSSPGKLEALVEKIRDIIRQDKNLKQDFFLVNFSGFGPSSLDIFIYCFTESTVWAEFLQARQEFMIKIMHAVKELGLDFAFPTQTVHIGSMPSGFADQMEQPDPALTGTPQQ
jgi:MscS family membrane protein